MPKKERITISQDGRDKGKTFQIDEMPCNRAEKWGIKVAGALFRNGATIPDGLQRAGMAAIAYLGIQAIWHIPFHELEPILDEMFECVRICPDPRNPDIVRTLVDSDIEEVMTRIKLREEILKLHVGFLLAVDPSISSITSEPAASENTPTSRPPSAPLSHRARQPLRNATRSTG